MADVHRYRSEEKMTHCVYHLLERQKKKQPEIQPAEPEVDYGVMLPSKNFMSIREVLVKTLVKYDMGTYKAKARLRQKNYHIVNSTYFLI